MQHDPFQRFERSRGGLLIPVAIFIVGALLTWAAIRSLDRIVVVRVSREANGIGIQPANTRQQAGSQIHHATTHMSENIE